MSTHTVDQDLGLKVPHTTLFLLQSLDGKISTGASNIFDVDADLPKLKFASKGLHQYYEAEKETDLWTMISGKTLAKLGINETADCQNYVKGLHRVVIGTTDLTKNGILNILAKSDAVTFIITSKVLNEHVRVRRIIDGYHNATWFSALDRNNLREALLWLNHLGCEDLTIQTGGTVNAELIKEKVIDEVHVIIAPVLIGGKNTPTLVDGEDRETLDDLNTIGELQLMSCEPLKDSYISLKYKVIK